MVRRSMATPRRRLSAREHDASCSSSSFPRLPQLLRWPLPRPFDRMLALASRRAFRCLDLDQILDLEPAAAQRAHLVAVREMELDAGIARPLGPQGGALLRDRDVEARVRIRRSALPWM